MIYPDNILLGVTYSAPIPFGFKAQQSDVMAIGTLGLELLMDPIFLNLSTRQNISAPTGPLNNRMAWVG